MNLVKNLATLPTASLQSRLRILQVCTSDQGGGAELSAWNLFRIYRDRGHASWLAVGWKRSNDSNVLVIPNDPRCEAWSRFWLGVQSRLATWNMRARGAWRLSRIAYWLGNPGRAFDEWRGAEDFHFPGTWDLLRMTPEPVDIIHCHNLHGGYFDLRVLSWLSHQVPVILDLRDAWLLSGHCAHSFDCDRWKTGCGQCPDLNIYPRLERDGTAYNWRRKQKIFSDSRLYIVTPCRWMMEKVQQSILTGVEYRIIPNGIDLTVFYPAEQAGARMALGLPLNSRIVLFAAALGRRNPWKDYATVRSAILRFQSQYKGENLLFLSLGEGGEEEIHGRARIRFIPFERDSRRLAQYYRAADVYIHAAKADTSPRTIIESLACGTPVVATAVGGIPEQIKGFNAFNDRESSLNRYNLSEATGVLVPQRDAESMALALSHLLQDVSMRQCLAKNAAQDALKRFDLQRQASDFIAWYVEILNASSVAFKRSQESPAGRIDPLRNQGL